jgi:hypothetical protein
MLQAWHRPCELLAGADGRRRTWRDPGSCGLQRSRFGDGGTGLVGAEWHSAPQHLAPNGKRFCFFAPLCVAWVSGAHEFCVQDQLSTRMSFLAHSFLACTSMCADDLHPPPSHAVAAWRSRAKRLPFCSHSIDPPPPHTHTHKHTQFTRRSCSRRVPCFRLVAVSSTLAVQNSSILTTSTTSPSQDMVLYFRCGRCVRDTKCVMHDVSAVFC